MPESQPELRRRPLSSLSTKIILFVFVSTFATAVVVSWTSIQSTHEHLLEVFDRHYPAALEGTARGLRVWLEDGSASLEGLARDEGGARSRGRADRLQAAIAASEHFDGLAWLSADGSIAHAVGSAAALAPASASDLGRDGLATARLTGEELVPVAIAEVGRGQSPDRLVAFFAADGLGSLLSSGGLEPEAVVLLADPDGEVLAASGPGTATRSLDLEPLLDPSASGIVEYTNASGLHVIGAARPLDLADWSVAVEEPFETAFAPLLAVVTRIFAIDLCVLLLFSLLAYKVTATVVQPIEALSNAARSIAEGQLDLEIPEPRSHDEIGLLTRIFNDTMRQLRRKQLELESKNRELEDRNLELQQAKEAFEQLSITDGLTRLHNHRFFQDHLTREIKRVNRVNEPLSMLLADIDDFKRLNDRLGHAAGDELLEGVARVMNENVRDSDLLARYGGEEFVVLASNTDINGAYQLAEKIRTAISEQSFILGDSLRPTRVTVSMGVAQYDGNRKKFFQGADRALYRAKGDGKNCVVTDDEDHA